MQTCLCHIPPKHKAQSHAISSASANVAAHNRAGGNLAGTKLRKTLKTQGGSRGSWPPVFWLWVTTGPNTANSRLPNARGRSAPLSGALRLVPFHLLAMSPRAASGHPRECQKIFAVALAAVQAACASQSAAIETLHKHARSQAELRPNQVFLGSEI